MGREIKRVALDFEWPLQKTWKGFLNPFYQYVHDCEHCNGSGSSPRAKELSDLWYGYVEFDPATNGSIPFSTDHPIIIKLAHRNAFGTMRYYQGVEFSWSDYDKNKDLIPIDHPSVKVEAERLCNQCFNNHWSHHLSQEDVDVLVKAGRLMDFTHTWTKDKGWEPKNPPYHPTAKEVNEWSLSGMGHDGSNQWICVKARCDKENIDHMCSHCKGEGQVWESADYEKQSDEWKPEEPPAGEGFQLWETVSEGSPVSPVFAQPEELAQWLMINDDTTTKGTTYEQWYKFIVQTKWAPSMAIIGGEVIEGVQL